MLQTFLVALLFVQSLAFAQGPCLDEPPASSDRATYLLDTGPSQFTLLRCDNYSCSTVVGSMRGTVFLDLLVDRMGTESQRLNTAMTCFEKKLIEADNLMQDFDKLTRERKQEARIQHEAATREGRAIRASLTEYQALLAAFKTTFSASSVDLSLAKQPLLRRLTLNVFQNP